MQARNTFVDLRNEVRDLKRMFIEIQEGMEPHFYDPSEYILLKEGLVLVLKFKGVYFSINETNLLSKTLGRYGIECDSPTIKRIAGDSRRWKELWGMGIETHYMKMTQVDRWICSDGNVLKKNLTPYRTNKSNSFIKFETETDMYNINRAEAVFKYFINPEVDSTVIFWRDGNFNDCGVDNITVKDFIKEEEDYSL